MILYKLYRLYYLAFLYAALIFGTVAMLFVPLMAYCYIMSFFSTSFGYFPWWSFLFIGAYGLAASLIRKAAAWELKRQKSLQHEQAQ
jgi:hypothetical protein